jgi:hypothetical protein
MEPASLSPIQITAVNSIGSNRFQIFLGGRRALAGPTGHYWSAMMNARIIAARIRISNQRFMAGEAPAKVKIL